MAGQCDHTICRGNKCIGNNGAGMCLFGDASPAQPSPAFHWVLENNVVTDNRGDLHGVRRLDRHVGQRHREQPRRQHHQGRQEYERHRLPDNRRSPARRRSSWWRRPRRPRPAGAHQAGPEVVLDASGSSDPGGNPLSFRWDFTDGTTATEGRVTHAFTSRPAQRRRHGNNGRFSDLGYRDFLVVEDTPEFGTEGQAADWPGNDIGKFARGCGTRSVVVMKPWFGPGPGRGPTRFSRSRFSDDLRGTPLGQVVAPAVGYHRTNGIASPHELALSADEEPGHAAGGQDRDWSSGARCFNDSIHAWKGIMPTVTLYELFTKFWRTAACTTCPPNQQGCVNWNHKGGSATRQQQLEFLHGRGSRRR